MMNQRPYTVSAVIPTRNRPAELERLLRSLDRQRLPLDEAIIVDSSDAPSLVESLFGSKGLRLKVVHSSPSVCRQRNIGIANAASEFIFLCDDDMEVPPDYLERLVGFLREHPEYSAVSGLIAEPDSEGVFRDSPLLSVRRLVWNFLFGLGAWGDLRMIRTSTLNRWLANAVMGRFLRKGNGETLAGWPVVLWWGESFFTTRFYGLGASVVRRSLLIAAPYDENLHSSGIGDHYGVALGFPPKALAVMTSARCYHHHSSSQRAESSVIYYRRILALDYFLRMHARHKLLRRAALMWSMIGNLIPFVLHGSWPFVGATLRAMWVIAGNSNPSRRSLTEEVTGIKVVGVEH